MTNTESSRNFCRKSQGNDNVCRNYRQKESEVQGNNNVNLKHTVMHLHPCTCSCL